MGVRAPRGAGPVRSQGALHRDRIDGLPGKGRPRRRGCEDFMARGAGHLDRPPEDPGDIVDRPARDPGQGVDARVVIHLDPGTRT